MSIIEDKLALILDATTKIEQFIDSDIEFDAKVDFIEEMLNKRQAIFDQIDQLDFEKTDHYRLTIKDIMGYDTIIFKKMEQAKQYYAEKIDDVQAERRNLNKANRVQKKYLSAKSETGYFINHKK